MKNPQPLVSILIPAYNAEKWLRDTIQSAAGQTWPKKEIIIVDDGSKDNTLQVAKTFESKSVKVVAQENRGASAARNGALSLAQGEYIQWLDADDLLAPDKIALQIKRAEMRKNKKILYSSAFGTFYCRTKTAKYLPTVLWEDLLPADWLVRKFSTDMWMNPAVWLVNRELTEVAGPWDERLSLDDDGEYFARIVAASEYVEFVREARSLYRQWATGSLSRSTSEKALRSLFLSLHLCTQHLLDLEDSERARDACVKRIQIRFSYFYPEQKKLITELQGLAKSLGGSLDPPSLGWKYMLIKNVLGWSVAKNMRHVVRTAKMLGRIRWEEIIYRISGEKGKYEK